MCSSAALSRQQCPRAMCCCCPPRDRQSHSPFSVLLCGLSGQCLWPMSPSLPCRRLSGGFSQKKTGGREGGSREGLREGGWRGGEGRREQGKKQVCLPLPGHPKAPLDSYCLLPQGGSGTATILLSSDWSQFLICWFLGGPLVPFTLK